VTIPSNNVTLQGMGNSTVLVRGFNSGNSGNNATIWLQGANCTIRDLKIDGNKDNYTVSFNSGIKDDAPTGFNNNNTIKNIIIENFAGFAISFSRTGFKLLDCTVKNSSYGIIFRGIEGMGENILSGMNVNGCIFENCYYGASIQDTSGISFNNNKILNYKTRGMLIMSCNGVIVSGNTIMRTSGYSNNDGIFVSSTDSTVDRKTIITGNNLDRNPAGITIIQAAGVSVPTGTNVLHIG